VQRLDGAVRIVSKNKKQIAGQAPDNVDRILEVELGY